MLHWYVGSVKGSRRVYVNTPAAAAESFSANSRIPAAYPGCRMFAAPAAFSFNSGQWQHASRPPLAAHVRVKLDAALGQRADQSRGGEHAA